jgi:hypothetical protein
MMQAWIEGHRAQCRTASNRLELSAYPVCRNIQHAKSMAWLSLDHLWLPSDKSPNQQNNKADVQI